MKRSFTGYRAVRAWSLVSLAAAFLLAGPVTAQGEEEKSPVSGSDANAEKFSKDADEKYAALEGSVAEAGIACENGDYEKGFSMYRDAELELNKQSRAPRMVTLLEKLKSDRAKYGMSYGDALFSQANDLYVEAISAGRGTELSSSKATEAMKLAENAKLVYYLGIIPGTHYNNDTLQRDVVKSPAFSERVEAFTERCKKLIGEYEYKKETTLAAIDPNYETRQADIQKLYRQGETLYKEKQYTKVRDLMEQILVLDPFNEKAMRLLEKTYKRLYFYAELRQYDEFLKDQAATDWSWMQSISKSTSVIPQNAPKEYKGAAVDFRDHLNSIVIDFIDLKDMPLNEAIQYIRKQSKDIDPEGSGINIVSKVSLEDSEKAKVTIQLDKVPLLEVIRYICQDAGYKFRVSDDTIIIGSDANDDSLETKFIPIARSVIDKIVRQGAAGNGDSSSSEDKGFATDNGIIGNNPLDEAFDAGGFASKAASAKAQRVESGILRGYFEARGVPFADGSSIAYDYRANKLTVRNTPDNIAKLELRIRDLAQTTPLVLIESKIVEIKMTDVEELGFDWLLTYYDAQNPETAWSMKSPLRDTGETNNKIINNMNIIPNFGDHNEWNLFLTVTAVDRTNRAEVLSTPKVTAINETEAEIKMVRQMYFPESWTEPEVTTNCGSSVGYTPSYPEFGDPTDVGIVFRVTPTVSPNNYTINLQLFPSVTDLTGWTDYSYDLLIGTIEQILAADRDAKHKVTIKMPEIQRREVETNVKVYDGQTVLIGGMLNEVQTGFNDKWPILGEVPVLGRFFSKTYNKAIKSNLLVSVTTRLVNGDGVPVRSNAANGLPDFGR